MTTDETRIHAAGSSDLPGSKRLGDILIEEGVLAKEDLDKLLETQSQQPPDRRRPIGLLAVEFGFLDDRRLRTILDQSGKRMRLGDLLVARGLIDQATLDSALAAQRELTEDGESPLLGEILIARGAIDEPTLTGALAEQCDLPYTPRELGHEMQTRLASLLNLGYCVRKGLAPASVIGRVLTVAIWHPSAIALQDEIEQSTGLTVRFVLDMRREVLARIRALHGLSEADFERVLSVETQRIPVASVAAPSAPAPMADQWSLTPSEVDQLARLREDGSGVLAIVGPTPDQVEATYLDLIRSLAQENGRHVHGAGRIRDAEEAEAIFRGFERRELRVGVFDVPSSTALVPNLLANGVDADRIAGELAACLAVCALRQTCPDCRESYQPHRLVLAEWFGTQKAPAYARWSRGVGCDACGGTGYRGERLIAELWVPAPADREAIRRDPVRASARLQRGEALPREATLAGKALRLALEGRTALEEVLKVIPAEEVRQVRRAA